MKFKIIEHHEKSTNYSYTLEAENIFQAASEATRLKYGMPEIYKARPVMDTGNPLTGEFEVIRVAKGKENRRVLRFSVIEETIATQEAERLAKFCHLIDKAINDLQSCKDILSHPFRKDNGIKDKNDQLRISDALHGLAELIEKEYKEL